MSLRPPVFGIRTTNHIGDSIITAGAVRNVKAARPDLRFVYVGWAPEIWLHNPDVEQGASPDAILPKIWYGPLAVESRAPHGNVVEGFTRCLCNYLGLPPVPAATRVPFAVLTDEEKEWGQAWKGKWLLNANCQTCSISKGYPHWQAVVDTLADDVPLVQVGSRERRNLSPDLRGVLDWRGRSEDVRSYMAIVHGCAGVISPPSGIVNIAAAFGKPAVVVTGARELARLTDYPGMIHVGSERCGFGESAGTGCIALEVRGSRACRDLVLRGNWPFAACMDAIDPDTIVSAVRRLADCQSLANSPRNCQALAKGVP